MPNQEVRFSPIAIIKFLSIFIDITSMTQTPSGVVAPETMITFNCQANGDDVTWFVNGTRRDESFSDFTIIILPKNNGDWNITLITISSIVKNNTRIQCYAVGTVGGQIARRFLNITIGKSACTYQY